MKFVIDGYGKSIHKKDNQIVIHQKDEIIDSVSSIKEEMTENIKEQRKLKNEYKQLIQELKKMKEIMNVTVYKGRWRLVKYLIK